MNIRAISRNIGYALLVSALFMLFSIFVSFSHGNDSALAALIISFTITFIVGVFPFIFVRKTAPITLKEGYLIITLSWLLSFIFGMLPYVLWGGPFSVVNAWFESVSGFTTTGSTILQNVEALPPSLLFWRASTHFIGGLGVVVFLLLIIPNSSPIRMRLTNMELSSLSKSSYSTRANKTVYVFAYVYIALLALAFVSYLLCGMKPLDAICHAMSVCATGGFSTRTASIGAFGSKAIEGVTMIFMFLSSIHFGLVFLVFAKRSLKPLNNPVLKFYFFSIVAVSLVLGLSLKFKGIEQSLGHALWAGAFHTLSITSTTGFAISDNSAWPTSINVMIMFMAVMCGCAGSTTGGVKADRVLVLLKTFGRQIGRILHPSFVNEVRLGNRILKDEEVAPHILYTALFCLLIAVSVLLSLALGVNDHSSFAASISSLSNVGPAIRELGTMGNFDSIPTAAKILYTIDMFLGRVEIYPVVAVVAMVFDGWKK